MMTNHLPDALLTAGHGIGAQQIRPGFGHGFNGAVFFDPEAAEIPGKRRGLLFDESDLPRIRANAANPRFAECWKAMITADLADDTRFIEHQVSLTNHVTDMIFSTQFVATTSLQVSFIADNLVQNSVAEQYNFYREFTIGTKYNALGIVSLYYDPHYAPSVGASRFGWEGGIEFPLFEDFSLRGGLYQNSKVPSLNNRGNGWGTGLGWMAPRISFDYAFSRETDPLEDSEHTIGTTIYF